MNVTVITGRLTDNPKYHEKENMAIAKFSLAVDREIKKEGSPSADFPRVVVFGKTATNCNKYLSKGDLIAVKGRLQTGKYENDKGETVYTTDVVAERVDFLSLKGEKKEEDNYSQLNEDVPF